MFSRVVFLANRRTASKLLWKVQCVYSVINSSTDSVLSNETETALWVNILIALCSLCLQV